MQLRKSLGLNSDHGKGFVFHTLRSQLCDFHVDPMVTDESLPPGVERERMLEYDRRFLRLCDGRRIVNREKTYRGDAAYFAPHFQTHYDLFLDPDKGIGGVGSEYLPASVIPDLIAADSDRVLLINVASINDHSDWAWLLNQVPDWTNREFQAFVVDLGNSGILFLANKRNWRFRFMRGEGRKMAWCGFRDCPFESNSN